MSEVKLGDALHRVTRLLGIPQCPSCARRRKALNLVKVEGKPLGTVVKDCLVAWLDPDLIIFRSVLVREKVWPRS